MKERECKSTGLLDSAVELRKLIAQNPKLPLLVLAGDDANNGDYSYMGCSDVRAYIGEYLDCMQEVNDCRVYTDRDDFEEDLIYVLEDGFDGTDEEWEQYLGKELAEYDPYWKKCILLCVDN